MNCLSFNSSNLGVILAILVLSLLCNACERASAWKQTSSNGKVTQIYSSAIQHNSDMSPKMRFYCRGSELFVELEFGKSIYNSYKGTQYVLANVASRIDDDVVRKLGFSMSEDRTVLRSTDLTSLSGGIKGLGVGIDNIIFNALGIKNRPRIPWTPEGLADSLSGAQLLTLEVKSAGGHNVAGVFDVSDFYDAYVQLPPDCRSGIAN